MIKSVSISWDVEVQREKNVFKFIAFVSKEAEAGGVEGKRTFTEF